MTRRRHTEQVLRAPGGGAKLLGGSQIVGFRPQVEVPSTRRTPNRRPWAEPTVAAAVAYGLLALVAYLPSWPGNPHRLPTCACADSISEAWYLAWTPFALLHGHNPLLTNFIDYPTGVNLAQNTSMPLLGVLSTPLGVAFGPVSPYTALLWLAFASSALAAFLVLRRWVDWTPAAFLGGLLYGFSPYMVSHGLGHLNLIFVPLPPVILLLIDELLIRNPRRPARLGLLLGCVWAAQFLISPEIFAGTLVMAAFGVAILGLSNRDEARTHMRGALVGLGTAAGVGTAIVAYPAAVQLAGPGVFVGSAHGSYPFPADALGAIVPSTLQWLAPSSAVAVSNRFIMGVIPENGSYLGVPLVLLTLSFVVWRRKVPIVRFSATMAAVAWVLSLGPSLTVAAHDTHVWLPVRLLDHLPMFSSFIDARFALYVDLFVAVILAVGIDRWRRDGWSLPGGRRPAIGGFVACGVAVALVVLTLIPDWPYPSFTTDVPDFFTTSAVQRVAPGSVALTYPYVDSGTDDRAMLWQATASMRFRMLGGYAIVRAPNGAASFDGIPSYLPSVPATLAADYLGTSPATIVAGASAATPADVRQFVHHYGVQIVLAEDIGRQPKAALKLLGAALGRPTYAGGVYAWFNVSERF